MPIEVRASTSGQTAYLGASRIRVVDVVQRYRAFLGDLYSAWPHINPVEITEAFNYWRLHENEIEEVIHEESEILSKIKGTQVGP